MLLSTTRAPEFSGALSYWAKNAICLLVRSALSIMSTKAMPAPTGKGQVPMFLRRMVHSSLVLGLALGIAVLGLAFARPAQAAPSVLLQDSFTNNTNYVNMTATTAYVDTTDHWVQLPQEPQPNAIALKEQGL